ncbi:MAG: magnesium/cobalt transporter CorA [Bacteroidetes bacterium]|nr:magnesium/cobalt transporter CorA [Bacteroidota bacterium]
MSKKIKKRKDRFVDPLKAQFIGHQYLDKPSLQLFRYNAEDYTEIKDIDPNNIPGIDQDDANFYWLNMHGIHDVSLVSKVCSMVDAHRLVVQDILDTNERTKLQEFDNHLFFTIRSVAYHKEKQELENEKISFLLGKNYVISFQEKKGDYFEYIRQRIRESKGLSRQRSSDYLLFLLLDAVLNNYFNVIESIDHVVSEVPISELIKKTDPEVIIGFENQKVQLREVKSYIMPFYDSVQLLENGDSEFIQAPHTKYFFDLKDQCLQVKDHIESLIQKLESMSALYFSLQGHRANEIMKTLTIVAGIFIPLSFIAGLYGMNFEYMPELGYKYAYFIVLGIMATVFIGMIWYFKRKKWF